MLKIPVQKLDKNMKTIILFCIFYIICEILQILFIFASKCLFINLLKYCIIGITYGWIIADLTLSILCILLWLACSLKDPGYHKCDPKIPFLELLKVIDATELCPDCKTIRTARSRHCIICHRCVERFDHHCPWINNCVGIKNHNLFLTYVLL